MKKQPTDWHKISADRDSRVRYNNIMWILAQIREQFGRKLEEADKNLEAIFQNNMDEGNRLSNNDTAHESNVTEFGNHYYSLNETTGCLTPISSERQLLCELVVTKKQVRVIAELPGVSEENIVIGTYPAKLIIIAWDEQTEYCEIFNIPDNTDTNAWKKSLSNGFFEIIFKIKSG